MSPLFDRSTDWIVQRPLLTTLLIFAISSVAMVGYLAPDLVTDLFRKKQESSGRDNLAEQVDIPDVDPVSLSDAHAIIVVESDVFFTPRGSEAMRHVVDSLESMAHVRHILWMDRVPILNIFGLPEPLFPRSTASDHRFLAAKEKALVHPLVGGQLLSKDGRTLLLLVTFDLLFVESDEDCTTGLKRAAEMAAADFADIPLSFGVTGRLPMYVTAMQTHEANQFRYQVIGYSMIALMAVILFRGLRAVLIVAIAPSLGVFWTLGTMRFFDFQNNPFNDVVLPILLSLVGLTDGVHLMVHIRRLRAIGLPPQVAAGKSVRDVGLACALTSLTTAIGFGSLSLAHHQIVRDFGWSCVIGVLLTFVAVITSVPLACSTRLGQRVHEGHEKGLIDQHLNRIGGIVEFVLKRTNAFSAAGILLTVVLVTLSVAALHPDERNSNSLPTTSEAAVTLRKLDKAMGGLEFSYVKVKWTDRVNSNEFEVLAVIREVDQVLLDEELISHPLSIRNLLGALPGDGRATDRMSMLELLPPPLKRAYYAPELREATTSFRVQDLGIAKYSQVFERIKSRLQQIEGEHPEFSLELTGPAVGRWENLFQIVTDLAASLGTAALIIFVVLGIVYRSLRIGLISIIPNVFPLAVTGAFLALGGQPLELVSVCAFTVCLGIAVDDTIHFLTRYLDERRKTSNQEEAICRAFTGVGTALIMTTVILIAGFATVSFSDSRDHRIFATMSGLTIASALLGDLIFLPALLARFAAGDISKRPPRVDYSREQAL